MSPPLRVTLSIAATFLVAGVVATIDMPDADEPPDSVITPTISLTSLGFNGDDSPIQIEARGRRFHWSFRYPGPDHRLGTGDDIVVDRDLRLPSGVVVELNLESDDFVYSLSCPTLGLREIAIPDLKHSMRIETAGITGSHLLVADPMCGWRAFHDEVMGTIIIEPIDE